MSILGTFVTPASVREQKNRLNPQVHALDASFTPETCPGAHPETLALWRAFVIAWDVFFKTDDGFFTAGAEYDFALAQEVELNNWRQIIAQQCKLVVGPSNVTPGTVPTNQPLPEMPTSTKLLIGGGIGLGILLLLKLK